MEKYFSVEDRNRRLHETVCMYDGMPVMVSCRQQTMNEQLQDDEVYAYPIGCPNPSYTKIKYTSDKFCAFSRPLGYINLPKGAYYVVRNPAVQYKQGLCPAQVSVVGRAAGDLPYHWITSKGLLDCIKNTYPSYMEALEYVRSTGKSQAFDRRLCAIPHFKGVLSLGFRGRPAGLIYEDNKITLFKSREDRVLIPYLQERGLEINEQ
jgi:hypothetical protein